MLTYVHKRKYIQEIIMFLFVNLFKTDYLRSLTFTKGKNKTKQKTTPPPTNTKMCLSGLKH